MSGAFATVNLLRDLAGPGTVGIAGDSPYFFIVSGRITLVYSYELFFIISFKCVRDRDEVTKSFTLLIAAFTALAMIMLHVCWGIVFMGSLDSALQWRKISGVLGVYATHLFVSGMVR